MATRFGNKRMAAFAAAIGLVVGFTQPATAADFCISYMTGFADAVTLVGKGFKVPGKGHCKPFSGFSKSTKGFDIPDLTGSACTSSDGLNVHFVVTATSRYGNDPSFFNITLPLPLGPDGVMFHEFLNGTPDSNGSPSGIACGPNPVP